MAERTYKPGEVETLSAELHAIYQREARRQAGIGEDAVRHPDEYDALPEHTKEYDRVLARFILEREEALLRVVRAAKDRASIRDALVMMMTAMTLDESDPEYEQLALDRSREAVDRFDVALDALPPHILARLNEEEQR